MTLKGIPFDFSVCRLDYACNFDPCTPFTFLSRTDDELSLVCRTQDAPAHTLAREDGWRAFRIEGTLDFSLIGILAGITAVLAENRIGVFAISTYNTDYILVKRENYARALNKLAAHGYTIIE